MGKLTVEHETLIAKPAISSVNNSLFIKTDSTPNKDMTSVEDSTPVIHQPITNQSYKTQDSATNQKLKRHSISIDYQYGIKESGLITSYKHASLGGGSGTAVWEPYGHHSFLVGYQYKLRPRIDIHSALSAGLGYVNGNQTLKSKDIGTLELIDISQSEWGAEALIIFNLFSINKFQIDFGGGASYRSFKIDYLSGSETKLSYIRGLLLPGEFDTYKNQELLGQGILRVKYHLPKLSSTINLTGVGQVGEFKRLSLRLGYTYILK